MLHLPYWIDSPINEQILTLTHVPYFALSQKTVPQSFQLCIGRAAIN